MRKKVSSEEFHDLTQANTHKHIVTIYLFVSAVSKASGKRFYSNTKLRRHLLIHTGDKPYECDVCGRRFNQMSSMISHKLVHMSTL